MQEFKFSVPAHCNLADAAGLIERVYAKHSLIAALKGSLTRYPGSIHWHCRRPNEKGVLELTLWPRGARLWAQVQDGRKAPWIDHLLPQVQAELEQGLRSRSAERS
jgi:hypothetical protein